MVFRLVLASLRGGLRLSGCLVAVLIAGVGCSGGDSTPAPTVATTATAIAPVATATATPSLGGANGTPLPAGLAVVGLTPSSGPIAVWVYADTPATSNCDDLLASMLPVELFGSSAPREKAACQPGNARYKFLQDSGGTFYLESVGILPIGLPSLPSFHEPHCESIVEHLVPGTADRATAKFVLVCDDRIPPRGSTPKTLQIWVRIVKPLAPAVLPEPSRPCWETSRYLGGYTEAETVELRCTLDE